MSGADDVTKVRRLFDEAMAESFDALFEAPDVVEVVSAVAQGDLAIVITGDSLRVVAVETAGASQAVDAGVAAAAGTGLYL